MTDSSSSVPNPPGSPPDPAVPAWPGVLVRPTRAPLLGTVAAPVARRVVLAAVGFGLLFQLLVVGQVVGINVLVWTATLMTMGASAAWNGRHIARRPYRLAVLGPGPVAGAGCDGVAAVGLDRPRPRGWLLHRVHVWHDRADRSGTRRRDMCQG